MNTPISLLTELDACPDAVVWVESTRVRSLESAWLKCERGDWMLWFAAKTGADHKTIVRAACGCARLALPHAMSPLVLACIEITEAWSRGEATLDQVRRARGNLPAYAAAAYAAAAHAAAAYAADTYAAHVAAAAAYVADTYAAHVAAHVAAAAARKKTFAQCAEIVRQHFPTLPQKSP